MFVFLKFYQKFPKLRIQISTHPSIYPFHPSSQSLNISKMVIRESDEFPWLPFPSTFLTQTFHY